MNHGVSPNGANDGRRRARAVGEVELSPDVVSEGRSRPQADHREALRSAAVADIPAGYSPMAHLLATAGVGLVTVVLSALRLHGPSALELLLVPAATFVFANGFEWQVHKRLLHKRTWPFGELYDRHTPVHHAVFVEDDMPVRDRREWRLVLIPAIGVAGAVAASAPVAALVGALFGANAGWLMLATSGAYMAMYELSHLAYHLPEDHPIGGSALVRFMRRHHAEHHDPRKMQRWNFNVTVPLFDWLLGTMAPRDAATSRPPPA